MHRPFLTGIGESWFEAGEFSVVYASSPEEAILTYIRHHAPCNEALIEYTRKKVAKASLAERFWLQELTEYHQFQICGEVIATTRMFEERVREFFGEYTDFAQIYLDYYSGRWESGHDTALHSFPDEMLAYTWFHSEWIKVVAFDISETEKLDD